MEELFLPLSDGFLKRESSVTSLKGGVLVDVMGSALPSQQARASENPADMSSSTWEIGQV